MSNSTDNWFQKLRRHPIFPVVVFIVFGSIVKENYPFSHFSMYSKPRNRPLYFAYLADGNGEPLSILWHTGLSTSKMSKMLNRNRGDLKDKYRSEGLDLESPEVETRIDREAGEIVLQYMRDLSMKRNKRELTGPLQMFNSSIRVEGRELVEQAEVIAELPGIEKPVNE